jgi:hypothetical protein
MNRPKLLQQAIGVILVIMFLAGCGIPQVTSTQSLTFPHLPTSTLLPPINSPQPPQPLVRSSLFNFIRSVQVTPDVSFLTGSFPRINYVPATNSFIVTFGTKAKNDVGKCQGAGYAYKVYTTDMKETGDAGRLIWYQDSCEAGDSGSVMVDNSLFFVYVPQDPGQSYGWHVVKYDTVKWTVLTETFVPLEDPYEGNLDPTVAFVNGQLDISDQYNPDGVWPEGASSHHHFFSTDLLPLGKRVLSDTPHISGASMIFVDGIYYIISATSYDGDLVVLKYDQDWTYLGVKPLIKQAFWSQGVTFDGHRFYVAYIDTSERTNSDIWPGFPNVHLAAFDREWNLLEDIAVTHFTPEDNILTGRPWVIFYNNHLYVSFDTDAVDPTTQQELLKWQAVVSIYELSQMP